MKESELVKHLCKILSNDVISFWGEMADDCEDIIDIRSHFQSLAEIVVKIRKFETGKLSTLIAALEIDQDLSMGAFEDEEVLIELLTRAIKSKEREESRDRLNREAKSSKDLIEAVAAKDETDCTHTWEDIDIEDGTIECVDCGLRSSESEEGFVSQG